MFDVVTRHFRGRLHHPEHSRDDPLQEIRFFAYNFFRDNVRERQNALQPVQKTQGYLIDLVLFFQKLSDQGLATCSNSPVPNTHLKHNVGNAENSLCNWVQLQGVNVLLVSTWKNGPLRLQFRI